MEGTAATRGTYQLKTTKKDGHGSLILNNIIRCGGAQASLCTASTESTWDLDQTSRGGTIFSSDAADNPAFYDYSKSKDENIQNKLT